MQRAMVLACASPMGGKREQSVLRGEGVSWPVNLATGIAMLLTALMLAHWSAPVVADTQEESVLAQVLPDSWRQFRRREPVFGADLFWVEAGPQDKPAVLVVHGLGAAGLRSLEPVITGLSAEYRVIAVDLPGFGLSGQPTGRYSPTNYAQVLHWLVTERKLKQLAVFGHSMGAAVALRFAASHPERVERLLLVNAAGILQRTAFIQHVASVPIEVDDGAQAIAAGADALRAVGRYLVEWSSMLPDSTAFLDTDSWLWRAFVDGRPSVNAALALVDEDFSQAIAELKVPAYIIVGTADPLAPPRTGRLLAGSLQNAQLFEMFNSDHIPMYTQNELFMALLHEALRADGVGEPYWRRPKWVWRAPDLLCDGQSGQRYSGYFKKVELRNCTDILLENVSAQTVSLVGSSARFYNLEVRGPAATGLVVDRSEVVLTNAEIRADTAISTEAGRVDVAGLRMQVTERSVVGNGENRLIVSVSKLRSPRYRGFVHGSFRLDNANLDAQLR